MAREPAQPAQPAQGTAPSTQQSPVQGSGLVNKGAICHSLIVTTQRHSGAPRITSSPVIHRLGQVGPPVSLLLVQLDSPHCHCVPRSRSPVSVIHFITLAIAPTYFDSTTAYRLSALSTSRHPVTLGHSPNPNPIPTPSPPIGLILNHPRTLHSGPQCPRPMFTLRRGPNAPDSRYPSSEPPPTSSVPTSTTDDSDTPASLLSPLLTLPTSLAGLKLGGFAFNGSPSKVAAPAATPAPPVGSDTSAVWQHVQLGPSPAAIPDDPHVSEEYPPPVEIASIPSITYDDDVKHSALPSVRGRAPGQESVTSARLLERAHWAGRGPIVAMTSPNGNQALVLLDLTNGKAFRRLDLGTGAAARVTSSARVIMLLTSHPTPSVYLLDSGLKVLHVVHDLPVGADGMLPVASVSGRLAAYATTEPAAVPGSDGLGSVVCAGSTRARSSSDASQPPAPQSTQAALLNSAVEIGGGVARGLWSGIKMGARAASASHARMAVSAPAERGLGDDDNVSVATSESRSMDDGLGEGGGAMPRLKGIWVKIIDLKPEPELIAHFRLPPVRSLISTASGQLQRAPTVTRKNQPVTFLEFSSDGTRLFAASVGGRAFHVFDVRPRSANAKRNKRAPKGEVWEAYILRRGNTSASVCSATWSPDDRWLAVGTAKGTLHVFPICPDGGKPSASSHVPTKIRNPAELSTLSVEVGACARLRPPVPAQEEGEADIRPYTLTSAAFTATRANPIGKSRLCQDLVLYRPVFGQLELARLDVFATSPTTTSPSKTDHRRRVSNLTEMMRLRPSGDLGVESKVKARWLLPLDQVRRVRAQQEPVPRRDPDLQWLAAHPPNLDLPLAPGQLLRRGADRRVHASVCFGQGGAHSPPELPARSRAALWHARLALARRGAGLGAALGDRPTATPLPHLPNGSPRSSLWNTIPIRHVASSVGEGVGRVRREYARASRRVSGTLGSSCDSPMPAEGEDVPPPMTTDGSLEDDWDDGWEAEYARAVEDDGGPDDLVLGLLDEEEEERRNQQKTQKEKKKHQQQQQVL
ncbi:hypothetical protein A1Q1_02727 [Trichosporon asahii var. asahii CBS 2479]|uniref:BCAS3 WD40 domain-containing protein n=1 Tax=Trichosporon asahii var. asahii (strain ATCC 90039 / CBS 2479 / JCM 2466 / KCTC 7840 / NBRC 103889/ NCYC 2677 / UAMH 7654) TaxID=1186058 RepID=J6EUJ4_TRIAS|nr:hypothetical protein A1Q1_02727 [Trichosporon asahii var. asahii CBS 2479]EJT48259.1 hypothetical protein A1Q1_02727 [Trichosporon asahii var. asahii CBS 2479]